MTIPTPELDRRSKVLDESQKIGEFLDWLNSKGWQIAKYESRSSKEKCPGTVFTDCFKGFVGPTNNPRPCERCNGTGEVEMVREDWYTENRSIEQLLADYFEIDLTKVEAERRAILADLQERTRPVVGS